jgi:site-specific DNA-adenine methylase
LLKSFLTICIEITIIWGWDNQKRGDKMRTYGISYMGSKTRIAEDLIAFLPCGKRFVDLFGGGGSMTHCAMNSGKWEYFNYNEINPLVTNLIKKTLNGDYDLNKFKPEFITRKKFNDLKDKDGYVRYIWSFGNNGTGYIYGKEIEEDKHALHDAVVFGRMDKALEICPEVVKMRGETINERRLSLQKIIKEINKSDERLQHLKRLERLQHLTNLERLQHLTNLERLERLEITCKSYLDYQFVDGDVVYCDPPYEGTQGYGDTFNHKQFYDWVASRDFPVYFSSYEISDNRFAKVWSKPLKCIFAQKSNSLNRVENLYCKA